MHIFVQWTNATLSLSTLNQISSREKKKKRKIKKEQWLYFLEPDDCNWLMSVAETELAPRKKLAVLVEVGCELFAYTQRMI